MPSLPAPGPGLARSLPFALFMALLFLRSQLDAAGTGEAAAASADSRWLYPLQAGAAALLMGALWRRYSELADWPALWQRHRGGLALALACGALVFAAWIAPDAPWMRQGGSDVGFVPVDAQGQLSWGLIALRCAGAVLVVPLMEELFWRSFLMRWIDQRDFLALDPSAVSMRALVLSSAVFALGHDQWLVAFLAGLAFGWIYRRSGQIWLAVFAHAVANALLAAYVITQGAWSYW